MALLVALGMLAISGPAFIMQAPAGAKAPPGAMMAPQQLLVASGALLAAAPLPAYAGGMFDFGLTLPFVAVTFLTMMAVLNTLWYSPVTNEMEERNAKLLQTLSEATDTLTKADEIQVEYTEQIKQAREKASKAVVDYRATTESQIATKIANATAERNRKATEVKNKLEADVMAKMQAAEAEIEKRKTAFVKETLAKAALG